MADALICAASVQRQLSLRNEDVPEDRKVRFRIGVNLGDVIEDRGDIYGDGVNVAARLESLAEPGGICVSESVHTVVGNKLPFDYEFMGEQQVKNIAKPVKAYRARLQPDSELPTPSKAHKRGKPTPSYIAVTAVVVLVVAASVFGWLRPWEPREEPDSIDRMAFPLPDKPSIAVLPFTNMSDDPEQEYFSDGISEDIITDLSRLSNLIVIARNSSFTYKGSPVKVQQVGQDLGVRYVLEGSVRKAGDRVRITAQLVDTSSGHHLWAERYDRKLTDIFELQDDITHQIVNELAIHLSEDDRRDLERIATNSFEAYDLFLRGQQISAQFTEEGLASAVELYRQAIRLDPGYAHAYSALGVARIRQFLIGYSDSPERTKDRALEMARKAESLDPTSHQIQWSLGYIYMYRKQFDEAEKAAKRAVSLSPNYADGYAMLALIKNNLGQAEETISLLEKAMALNPYYTWDYVFQLGRAYYAKGEYDKVAPTCVM